MIEKLYSFLDDASANKDTRFDILQIALDWLKDADCEAQCPAGDKDLLIYTLRWLIKHKKFPKVENRTTKTKQRSMVGFDRNAVIRQFLDQLSKSSADYKNRSIDNALKNHISRAERAFRATLPTKTTTKQIISLYAPYAKEANLLGEENQHVIIHGAFPGIYGSTWGAFLSNLTGWFAFYYNTFYKGM